MVVQKLLDLLIGAALVLVMFFSIQLVSLYRMPEESLAQEPVQRKYSHPVVNGQQIAEMPDVDCLSCHRTLP